MLLLQHGRGPLPRLARRGPDGVHAAQLEAAHGRALVRGRGLAEQPDVGELQRQLDVGVGAALARLDELLPVLGEAVHVEVQVVDRAATE